MQGRLCQTLTVGLRVPAINGAAARQGAWRAVTFNNTQRSPRHIWSVWNHTLFSGPKTVGVRFTEHCLFVEPAGYSRLGFQYWRKIGEFQKCYLPCVSSGYGTCTAVPGYIFPWSSTAVCRGSRCAVRGAGWCLRQPKRSVWWQLTWIAFRVPSFSHSGP